MTKKDFCANCFNWIKSKIIDYRSKNPLEWNTLNLKYESTDVISKLIVNNNNEVWFDINDLPHQLYLMLSFSKSLFNLTYQLNMETMKFERTNECESSLEYLYSVNSSHRPSIELLFTLDILDRDTFQFKKRVVKTNVR
jgi:hypothetical protein